MAEIPESHRDLLAAPVAALATVGPDGWPQVTGVWFLDDDGELRISLNETRQKLRNLRADPRCTLFVFDPANPYRYLEVRADAEVAPDPGGALAARVGAKYDTDVTDNDGPGEQRLAVTLRPVHVTTR